MNRAKRRELERIERKLKEYIKAFQSICYFDETELDWNIITEQEFRKLKGRWKKFCTDNQLSDEYKAAFHWDCMMLKTDLILQIKYNAGADKDRIIPLLKKGMQPLEVADQLNKQLLIYNL